MECCRMTSKLLVLGSLFVVTLALLANGCQPDRPTLSKALTEEDIQNTKAALQAIRNADEFYRRDHNTYTTAIEDLLKGGYLSIDKKIQDGMVFSINNAGEQVGRVSAVSNSGFSGGKGWIFALQWKTDKLTIQYAQ